VMGDAARLIAVGLVMGLAGAWVFGQSLRSLIYGIDAGDPRVLLIGVLIVVVLAGLGAYLPSRRAASVDPLIALRVESLSQKRRDTRMDRRAWTFPDTTSQREEDVAVRCTQPSASRRSR